MPMQCKCKPSFTPTARGARPNLTTDGRLSDRMAKGESENLATVSLRMERSTY